VLEIDEIKTVSGLPISHPFVERLNGTVRREYLDHTLFWNVIDLERKPANFQAYYNHHRTHSSLVGDTPAEIAGGNSKLPIELNNFRWQTHCQGLYQLRIASHVVEWQDSDRRFVRQT
jgi:putative transposase